MSLGKPPRHCHGTRHSTAKPATLSCPTGPQPPNKPSTPIANARRICSPCSPICLLLQITCTGPGCGSHVPGTGSSCTGVGETAQTTWSTPCSAKGGGPLTPQTSQKFSPAGYGSSSSTASPMAVGLRLTAFKYSRRKEQPL